MTAFRDHRDQPVDVGPVPGPEQPSYYLPIGAFQGDLYARNAFAVHTVVEVNALIERCGLAAGDRVIDIGCGNGRHLRELARRGISGVGLDVSPELVSAARDAVAAERDGWPDGVELGFEMADARDLGELAPVLAGQFDAGWTLCQGAFGTHPGSDPSVLSGLASCVRPGGVVAFTAFHALFAVRHLVDGDAFDPIDLVHHQTSEVRGPDDERRTFDLWTAAYTARDCRRLAADLGLSDVAITGCEPGRYDATGICLDDPELLVVGVTR